MSVQAEEPVSVQSVQSGQDIVDPPRGAELTEQQPRRLRRSLSFFDAFSLVIGLIVGSGIFASPGAVLESTHNVGLSYVAWLLAAVAASASAVHYAELSALWNTSGSDAFFLGEVFGESWSFAVALTALTVTMSGSCAIVAIVFGNYTAHALFGASLDETSAVYSKSLAVASMLAVTVLQTKGAHEGAVAQKIFLIAKFVAAGIVVCGGFYYAGFVDSSIASSNFSDFFSTRQDMGNGDTNAAAGFGVAFVAAMWAYDGYQAIGVMGKEMRNPRRDLPLVVSAGMPVVALLYILVNAGLLMVLPARKVATSTAVAVDALQKVAGDFGGTLAAICVAIAALGSLNGSVFTTSRIVHWAAQKSLLPLPVARCSNASRVLAGLNQASAPRNVLWLVFLVATVLCLSGDFSSLLDYFAAAQWVFQAMVAVAVLKMRRVRPLASRGDAYSVKYVALTATIVIGVAVFVLVSECIEDIRVAAASTGVIASGLIIYVLCKRTQGQTTTAYADLRDIDDDVREVELELHESDMEQIPDECFRIELDLELEQTDSTSTI